MRASGHLSSPLISTVARRWSQLVRNWRACDYAAAAAEPAKIMHAGLSRMYAPSRAESRLTSRRADGVPWPTGALQQCCWTRLFSLSHSGLSRHFDAPMRPCVNLSAILGSISTRSRLRRDGSMPNWLRPMPTGRRGTASWRYSGSSWKPPPWRSRRCAESVTKRSRLRQCCSTAAQTWGSAWPKPVCPQLHACYLVPLPSYELPESP